MSGAFDDASYKPITREEVAKNNTDDSLWCIIDHRVYDLTDFLDAHPGGSVVLQQVAGKDATVDFFNLHRYEVLQKYSSFCIGVVKGEKPEVIDPKPGDVSLVPYAEPAWLSPIYKSPYYNETHRKLHKGVREFVDSLLRPELEKNEAEGTIISKDLVKKMAENNILAARMGPGAHMKGRVLPGGVQGSTFDYFSDLVVCQELVRVWSRGAQDGNVVGAAISLTAVRSWMKNVELREKVTEEVLSGQKMMVLCVTEAFAGSDVAGIKTTVTKSKDGKSFIVKGTKKWITNGTFSDYFVVAGRSEKGHTVVLVPRSDNVTTKPIKTSYSPAAGTAFIEFDTEVPVDHLLGEEHKGFPVIMGNFNHERWAMAAASIRYSRFVVEECLKWCHQRIVFGKPLIQQPVLRNKLARMVMLVEAGQAYIEQITYQMNNMSYDEQNKHLGGPIGLLKAYVSRTATEIADNATNILGGRGITQTGMGTKVEQFNRTYKFDAILGGTEEILMDLAIRQASKQMPKSML